MATEKKSNVEVLEEVISQFVADKQAAAAVEGGLMIMLLM